MDPKPYLILLVEDDEAHIILIQRAFQHGASPVDLMVTRTLREAQRQLRRNLPDLIIADLVLPDGRGVELLGAEEHRSCPVVVMTSHGDEHVAVEAIKAGALDYVVKSEITFQDMPHIAERALREWQLLIERRQAKTELQKANRKLQEQNIFLNEVFESFDHPFYVIDADTYQVVMANSRANFAPLDKNSKCYCLTHARAEPCSGQDSPCPLKQMKKTHKPVTVEHIHYNWQGRPRIVEVHAYPILNEQGRVTQMIEYFLDITERKTAEKKLLEYQDRLRSLASQLSLVEERERQRIATQLHDRIGQNLIFSKMNLDALRVASPPGQTAETLGEISSMIDQAIQDTRSLTFELGSPILYELGLEAALAELLTELFQKHSGIRTRFEDDAREKPVDDDVRILLYQVVREILVNIIKHAQAENVTVSVGRENGTLRIVVSDDGKGIEADRKKSLWSQNGGFGLFSIRERLGYLGGQMEIESQPGQGTRVTITAPLQQTAAADEGDQK